MSTDRRPEKQVAMFSVITREELVWDNIVPFHQPDGMPYRTVTVHCETERDYREFRRLMKAEGLEATGRLNSYSFWWPPRSPKDWQAFEWLNGGNEE